MSQKRLVAIGFLLLVLSGIPPAVLPSQIIPDEDLKSIMPMRERVKLMEKWWKWKKEHVLPMVMREQGVDMWIIRNDEADLYYNNEGPVYTSLLPANHEEMTFPSQYAPPGSQRIPRFLMFLDDGISTEYIELKDYDHITEIVKNRDPRKIAIGQHRNERMLEALGQKYASRSVDSWTIGIRWLETMSPEQISVYRHVQRVANEIIAEAFSNRVVIPDVTTTDDLNWWVRQKLLELKLEVENHPSITIQRNDANVEKYDDPPEYFRTGRTRNGVNVVIRRGDIISCDTDLFLLGLVTDSHQHAYVLREEEADMPEALKEALRKVNRIQDLFRKEFQAGRTGKEIVATAKKIKPEDGVIETGLGFHPPPMFIRRFL